MEGREGVGSREYLKVAAP
ncbi:hypothetical protein E2C01_069945 [Portunus trituberculatus]|uniref:Uncharacterized protein n=1 Tax=Portunus trituberculatus TaxID=210409 RepID=A0A5B7I0B0_PORTR|nr:hypothetical protein [Portunus trituberculatus]